MRTDSIIANLRALLRANSIIAEIHARHVVTRSSIAGFAALIAAFGLVMFGVAAFLALETLWGPIWAAVAIGAASCVIALALFLAGRHIRPGRDLDLAREVHRSAVEGLTADARALEAELVAWRNVANRPFEQLIPSVIIPLAGILLKALKRRDKQEPES